LKKLHLLELSFKLASLSFSKTVLK